MGYSNGLGLPEEILLGKTVVTPVDDETPRELDQAHVIARKNRVIQELREALTVQAARAENAIDLLRDMRHRRDAAVELVNQLAEELRQKCNVVLPTEILTARFESLLRHLKEKDRAEDGQ